MPADAAEIVRLAGRVEQATAEEERDWLQQAFYALNPAPECGTLARHQWVARSSRFHDLCAAEAYIDAAMTLVPAWCDCRYFSDDPSGTSCRLGEFTCGDVIIRGEAITPGLPALAVTAAALRARAAQHDHEVG